MNMTMHDVFENVLTLQALKTVSEERQGLLFIRKKLHNNSSSALLVIEWLNSLISEYNSIISDAGKAKTAKQYNVCLFNAIGFFLPFLPKHSQLYAYSNRCILTDDDSDGEFHDNCFVRSLDEANDYIRYSRDRLDAPDAYSYYVLGFLNFRAQYYDDAIWLLERSTTLLGKRLGNDAEIEDYVSAVIYLANCFEYKNEIPSALKELLGTETEGLKTAILANQDRIIEIITQNYSRLIMSNDVGQDVIGNICDLLCGQAPNAYRVFKLRSTKDERNKVVLNRVVKQYIHVLAHCLSEYSASLTRSDDKSTFPFISLLQLISRFFIDWLTKHDDSFVTCQATVRAENDACPEGLNLLLTHYYIKFPETAPTGEKRKYSEKDRREKAELEFYIFYFAEQELRFNYEDKQLADTFETFGKRFKNYAESIPDNDSLFHYYVIQFKYQIKRAAKESLKFNVNTNFESVDAAYYDLLDSKQKVLRHVFKWLIDECDRLESLYVLFREFRYLNKYRPEPYNMQEFVSLLASECSNVTGNYAEVLRQKYEEIEKREKILILAPVYEAPSCSFSVRNIDELLEIKYYQTATALPQSISGSFRGIGEQHTYTAVAEKRFIVSKKHFNAIKWAMFYTGNQHLFLYYEGLQKDIVFHETNSEMFPVILNNGEKVRFEQCLKLLTSSLDKEFESYPYFNCSVQNHTGYSCHTRLLNCSVETESSKALIELLVFLEFDFYNPNGTPRILASDNILIFKCPNMWGSEYRVIGFATDLSELDQVDICNLVNFSTTPPQSVISVEQPIPPIQNKPILFEWDKMKDGLQKRKTAMERNNQDPSQLNKCQDLINSITEYMSQDELRQKYVEAQKIGYTYEG